MKKGFYTNIEKATEGNNNFRKVLYTGDYLQLVLMSLLPGENIGMESHDNDQFVRVEEGEGECSINGKIYKLEEGDAVIVPEGAKHDFKNTSKEDKLKIYIIYSPPHHKDGIVRPTKKGAEKNPEEFDGETTE